MSIRVPDTPMRPQVSALLYNQGMDCPLEHPNDDAVETEAPLRRTQPSTEEYFQ